MTKCPYCGGDADAEFVDIGVGFEQVTPYRCGTCEALQIAPHQFADGAQMTDEERQVGWFRGPPELDPRSGAAEAAYLREPEDVAAIRRGLLAPLPPARPKVGRR